MNFNLTETVGYEIYIYTHMYTCAYVYTYIAYICAHYVKFCNLLLNLTICLGHLFMSAHIRFITLFSK